MGLGFFKKFVTTAYMGVVVDSDRCDVFISVYRGVKKLKTESHTLRMEEGELSRVGVQFINGIYKKYYFVYSGALLLSINQGAFSGIGKSVLDVHEIRQVGTKTIEMDKLWTFYASEGDLKIMQQAFARLGGLDFIFSSYSVISSLKDTDACALYILKLHGFASIAVFDKKELLYGNFFMFAPSEFSFKDDFTLKGSKAEQDDAAMDDGFSSMDYSDDESDDNDSDQEDAPSLEKEIKLIDFIKACLTSYYKDPIYDARFIDKIVVLDPYGESDEFKALAQDELLLEVDVKAISLAGTLCEFTQQGAL